MRILLRRTPFYIQARAGMSQWKIIHKFHRNIGRTKRSIKYIVTSLELILVYGKNTAKILKHSI